MKVYYKHGRYITGNMYMVLRVTNTYPSEKFTELMSLGIITQEAIDAGMQLLSATKSVSGCYPVIYICSENIDGTLNHICFMADGKLIQVAWRSLLSMYPASLYDGSEFQNGFVKGLLNETYDSYGVTCHDSSRSKDNVILKLQLGKAILYYGSYEITLRFSDGALTLNKPIKKEDINTTMIRKLNSAIYALYNKEKYMLIETGDEYLLLKI